MKKANRNIILAALLLSVALGALAYYGSVPAGLRSSGASALVADISANWVSYTSRYGFTVHYPGSWHIMQSDDGKGTPYVTIGNPLQGSPPYLLKIWIVKTPEPVTADEYVKHLLAVDAAIDEVRAKTGSVRVTPIFTDQYALSIGNFPAYELFNVFEFDHNAEQVYVSSGDKVLVFDFPIAAANPNLASPIENNAVAREIMKTLELSF